MTKTAVVFEPAIDLQRQIVWCRRIVRALDGSLVVLRMSGAPSEAALETAGVGQVCDDVAVVPVQDGESLLAALRARDVGMLLMFRHDEAASHELRQRMLGRASCEMMSVQIGEREPSDPIQVLVPMARGPHARVALKRALQIVGEEGTATALYVEPELGLDTELVGLRVLDRLVEDAVGVGAGAAVRRRVVIADGVAQGIVKELEGDARYGLVLTGATKAGAIGRRIHGTVTAKVAKAAPAANVALVRAAVPFAGRLRHALESWFLRTVPQLEREHRVAFVERVQSNSYWDFDFIALMSLATSIAAMGLVQSSEAVVIGAMLVAPLMTPIVGCGLALVHGNPVLARTALRSVAWGFVIAFAIGFGLGALHPGFEAPTAAMLARDWPDLLDLLVAFIAGFAGAYATSRPGLSAALPGVAIAAALVPPIATSGLALSLGNFSLSMGAAMLFFTNMVAIILASNICLWMVGMRSVKVQSASFALAGKVLVTVVLALGIWFSLGSLRVTESLRAAIRARVGARYAVREVGLERSNDPVQLYVRIAGPAAPVGSELTDAIRKVVCTELEIPDARVHVEWRWEQWSSGDGD